ncbi:hypothetical protein BCR44DRAFT_1438107, partial [Catenaria anguillulae PL171]
RSIGLVVCQSTSFAPSQLRLCQPSRRNLAATAQLWTPVAACANANALCTVVHKMYTHVSDADFAKLHSGFRDWFGVIKSPPQIFGQHLTTSPNRQALGHQYERQYGLFPLPFMYLGLLQPAPTDGWAGSFQESTRCIDDVSDQPRPCGH